MELIKAFVSAIVLVFIALLLMLFAHPAFGVAIAGYLGYLAADKSKVSYGVLVFFAVLIAALLMKEAAVYLNDVLNAGKESVYGYLLVSPILGFPVSLYLLKMDKLENSQGENIIED
jgi:hypothetical protein